MGHSSRFSNARELARPADSPAGDKLVSNEPGALQLSHIVQSSPYRRSSIVER